MKAVGTRATYQIFAAITFITGCLYYAFNRIYIDNRRDQDKDNTDVSLTYAHLLLIFVI